MERQFYSVDGQLESNELDNKFKPSVFSNEYYHRMKEQVLLENSDNDEEEVKDNINNLVQQDGKVILKPPQFVSYEGPEKSKKREESEMK